MDKQSILLRANGDRVEIEPKDGKYFGLEELYKLIDADTIQIIQAKDKEMMIIVDEDGKERKKPFNIKATTIASLAYQDFIVGDVVVCPRKFFK